ncbi:unnamed protein product [Camellia sinensis]
MLVVSLIYFPSPSLSSPLPSSSSLADQPYSIAVVSPFPHLLPVAMSSSPNRKPDLEMPDLEDLLPKKKKVSLHERRYPDLESFSFACRFQVSKFISMVVLCFV